MVAGIKSLIPVAEFLGPSAEEILSCVADAVISTDEKGNILLFNPAAEKLFGYSATDVLGTSIHSLIPTRFREAHASDVAGFGSAPTETVRAMGSEREVCGLRRDGTEFPAEATLSRRSFRRNTILTVVIRDVSHRNKLDEQRNLIASEMAHRFKNIMAMVNAVVSLTARSVSTVEEFRDVLNGRLHSISRTQDALLEPGRDIQMIDLVEMELAPFRNDNQNRITAQGPEVTISMQHAISIILALHELAANAAKYGSLSSVDGSVKLNWTTAFEGGADYLLLEWIETGGPPVELPVRRGFGSDLLGRCFGPSNSVVEYNPDGVKAQFRIRL